LVAVYVIHSNQLGPSEIAREQPPRAAGVTYGVPGAPEIHREADAVPVVIDGKGYGQVFVADLLPRGTMGAKEGHGDL